MFDPQKNPGRRRPNKNVFTTKSGNTIKLNRSLGERVRAGREAKARKRAAYLSSLPRNKWKRLLYRLHPKRVIKYWFSREGAIMALKLTGVGIIAVFLLMVGVFAYFRKDLPNIKDISGDEIGGSITYFDRTGQVPLWQDYDAVKRIPVTGDNISKYVKQATIAIEDKNFYKHGAFDVQGIARAVVNDVTTSGGPRQGGSTITQQLVKLNQNWTQDRSITRKFKELILAVELEREYSKDDILTGYLNVAPYGNIQYGVESASQDYFRKSAKDLNLAEGAFMAAIPQAPSYYSPYGASYDPEKVVGRQHYILDQMADQKMITQAEADAAKKVDILSGIQPTLQPKYEGIKAPYFVLAAKEQLERDYGGETVQRGGWKVTTTVDLKLQQIAEEQVSKGMKQIVAQKGDTAAFAAVDVKTGQMVALVGGPDFNNPTFGKINWAKQRIPPGSSFKPYDYATLINESDNVGAGSVLYDDKNALPGYDCKNKARPKDGGDCLHDYDFLFPGPVTIRYALGGSRNVPAVKAMLTVGADKVRSTAEAMGLTSGYTCPAPGQSTETRGTCYGSAGIGDGAFLHIDEHANALATLSRMGKYVPQTYILNISNSRGKVIQDWKQPEGKQVLKPDTAFIINDILADPKASYLRTDRKFHNYKGWRFAIKTGTTNDNKDALMMSYSSQYAAVVWTGEHTRGVEMKTPMENMTQPIVQGWMRAAHDTIKTPAVNWEKPAGVKMVPAYVLRSKISGQAEIVPSPSEDLAPSWYKEPTKQGSSAAIDKVSGKLATSCTPDAAKENQGNASANIFSVDIFSNKKSGSVSSTEQDNVHNCSDVKPQLTLTAPTVCSASCAFTVTVTQGTHALSSDKFAGSVALLVNGQQVEAQSVSSSPSTITFAYTPTAVGDATVEARVTDSVLYTSSDSRTVTMSQ